MSKEKFGQEIDTQITPEEQVLAVKSAKAGGESKLSKEDCIRLIALRHMRSLILSTDSLFSLSEEDATELATLQYNESGLSKEDMRRLVELRKKRGVVK